MEIAFGGALLSSLAEVIAEVIRDLRGPIATADITSRSLGEVRRATASILCSKCIGSGSRMTSAL